MASGPVIITLLVNRRWWYGIAYVLGIVGVVLRILNDEEAERYATWMVENGTVFEVRTKCTPD
jgi:hypothetical protein